MGYYRPGTGFAKEEIEGGLGCEQRSLQPYEALALYIPLSYKAGAFFMSTLYMALYTSLVCECDDPKLPGKKWNQVCKVVGLLSDVLPAGLRYANELRGR